MANIDPALHAYLNRMEILRDKAKELIELINKAPLAQMTRDDLKTIEFIERRTLPLIDRFSYLDKDSIGQDDLDKLKELKSRLSSSTPA